MKEKTTTRNAAYDSANGPSGGDILQKPRTIRDLRGEDTKELEKNQMGGERAGRIKIPGYSRIYGSSTRDNKPRERETAIAKLNTKPLLRLDSPRRREKLGKGHQGGKTGKDYWVLRKNRNGLMGP